MSTVSVADNALELQDRPDHAGERAASRTFRSTSSKPRILRLLIEIPESDDYDTVGGYVVTTLGRIPEAGEAIELDDAKLTILEAAPTRVLRVRVERTADAPPLAATDTEERESTS